MSFQHIRHHRAGRFLAALMLAYALLLQLVVPQAMAFASDTSGEIICLSTTNTNTPDSPLKSHRDCTCPAFCAAAAFDTAPETASEILPPLGASHVIAVRPLLQALDLHLWSGVNARGPP